MEQRNHYRETLGASLKVNWRIEDLVGTENRLDFDRPFLPEKLARVRGLAFLSPREQIVLNQIRGHGYLAMFGLVENVILPFVMDHARSHVHGEDWQMRALLNFAGEEAKHIHLFNRFEAEFRAGFGSECRMIGPAEDIAREVLAHHPLSVGLLILAVEWMTQAHYLDSVRDDQDIDPRFRELLRKHWVEEAQHARLDTLVVEEIAAGCTPAEIDAAVDGLLEIGGFLDAGLKQQVEFDLEALALATGRTLSEADAATFRQVQHQAQRYTYIGSGLTHRAFLSTLEKLTPAGRAAIDLVSPSFC